MKIILSFTLLTIGFVGCNHNNPKELIAASQAIQIDEYPSECPALTKDANGNTVLSWVRLIDEHQTAFCYATSRNGKTFEAPVVIPNSSNIQPHGENLPKIIFKPSGEIIALWGAGNPNPKNKYSGLVFYTQSFDAGKTWTAARPLVSDTASYDQRYYDIALLPNGEAAITWLDNRKTTTKQGSALYFATTNGSNGFGEGRLISQPCCPCCRTDLYVDKKGGIHALFRGIVQDSIRDMVHIVSNDGGKTFSDPKRISEDNWVINGCPHTGPAMSDNNDGIHFAWFTGGRNKGCYYTKSTNNGKTFVLRDSVSALGSHPQLSTMSNGTVLIVWDETHVTGNIISKQIGIQQRNAAGNAVTKNYLTTGDSEASYPVISPSGEHNSIVAYSTKKGEKNFVAYQVITLE